MLKSIDLQGGISDFQVPIHALCQWESSLLMMPSHRTNPQQAVVSPAKVRGVTLVCQ
jgi:hypothetical protein